MWPPQLLRWKFHKLFPHSTYRMSARVPAHLDFHRTTWALDCMNRYLKVKLSSSLGHAPAHPSIYNHMFSSKPPTKELDDPVGNGTVSKEYCRAFWESWIGAWSKQIRRDIPAPFCQETASDRRGHPRSNPLSDLQQSASKARELRKLKSGPKPDWRLCSATDSSASSCSSSRGDSSSIKCWAARGRGWCQARLIPIARRVLF